MSNAASIPFSSRPTPAPIEQLKSLDQVAELLDVNRRTVERLIAAGELVAVRIGSRVKIDPADLRRYIDSRKT
jgi:excisionase family DNA binding protein